MRALDETDLEILQSLMSNARRPDSDVADVVGLSAPAVTDRVARLQETGVRNRFTLEFDRSELREGIFGVGDVGRRLERPGCRVDQRVPPGRGRRRTRVHHRRSQSFRLCGSSGQRHRGTATRVDGALSQFRCPSCESRFEEKYEELQLGSD